MVTRAATLRDETLDAPIDLSVEGVDDDRRCVHSCHG